MATLIFHAIGAAIAGPIGAAFGALAGTVLDRALIGGPNVRREGPRLADLTIQNSSYGEALPLPFGTTRIAGNVIWSSGLVERRNEQTQGGGKAGSVTTTSYTYSASFAVALAGHPLAQVKRIWADGKLIRTLDGTLLSGGALRIYAGDEAQEPDPLIEAAVGSANAPAHRGTAYVVFDDLPLADFANRIPNLTFEVQQLADTAASTVSAVLKAAGQRCGLRRLDINGPLGALPGFVLSGQGPVRDSLDLLLHLQPVRMTDVGGSLLVGPINAAVADVLLPRAALGAADSDGGDTRLVARESRLTPVALLPNEVQIRYSDPVRDYQVNMQRARRRITPAGRVRTEDVPAVLAADTAKQLAERLLADSWRQRRALQVRLPQRYVGLLPGQSCAFDDLPQSLWLIESIAIEQAGLTLTLLPLSGLASSVPVADTGPPISQNPLPHGATEGLLLDLPPIEAQLPSAARLFAVAAGASAGWRRASLWLSVDQAQSYTLAATLNRTFPQGIAQTALAAGPTGVWDDVHELTVTLLNPDMHLLSRTAEQVLGGANLMRVGDELLQFRSALPTGPQSFRLSGLLRGRRGTEAAVSTHVAGEACVLLDPLPDVGVPVPLTHLGQTLHYKLLSPGDSLGDVPARTLPFQAQALRPLAPVHLSASVVPSGDRLVQWVRRSRDGFHWLDGVDAPLAEVVEAYRVQLLVSGQLRRTADVAGPAWTYTTAQQAADDYVPGASEIRVAQISAQVGPGTWATLPV